MNSTGKIDDYTKLPPIPISPTHASTRSQPLFSATKSLWYECKLLMRIDYKSRNQHRTGFYYRKLKQVERSLKNIAKLELWLQTNTIQSDAWLVYLDLLRSLILKSKEDCIYASQHFKLLLDQQLFMPLALVTVSILARINYCLQKLDQQVVALIDNSKGKKENELVTTCKLPSTLQVSLTSPDSTALPIPSGLLESTTCIAFPSSTDSAPKSIVSSVELNTLSSARVKKRKKMVPNEIDEIFSKP